MKIARMVPLAEHCPPRLYGGTERIVSYLTGETRTPGTRCDLFASGDSRTEAQLVRCSDMAGRLNPAGHRQARRRRPRAGRVLSAKSTEP